MTLSEYIKKLHEIEGEGKGGEKMNINQIIEQHTLWLDTDGKEGYHADFTDADLTGVDFSGVNLTSAELGGANFTSANLEGAKLNYANLGNAILTGASLVCAKLEGASLGNANLIGATLRGASLYYANLTYANLTNANLTDANLYKATLSGANLSYANLTNANLHETKLANTSGNSIHLKSIFCGTYPIAYTAEVMQIGCQRHKFEDWWSFDDDRIIAVGGERALNWWRIWKPILQQIIAASPAIATGYVKQTHQENN